MMKKIIEIEAVNNRNTDFTIQLSIDGENLVLEQHTEDGSKITFTVNEKELRWALVELRREIVES
jgi:hypothetical protein